MTDSTSGSVAVEKKEVMASMDEFERAQAQAMELLIQQCVSAQDGALSMPAPSKRDARESAAANATILDLLAQTCADANAAVQEMSVEQVATGLADAVAATQDSLRSVGQNVGAILQDPEQMAELCYHVQQADAQVLEALNKSSAMLDDEYHEHGGHRNDGALVAKGEEMGALMVPPDEENVRNMMVFAESMCTTMDHALSTITKDELSLAAQLSLNIAQKLLDAGQSLFTSLGDEERRKVMVGDQGDRISIEELEEDEVDAAEGSETKERARQQGKQSPQLKRAAVLRTYVADLYSRTREGAVEHPFLAGALTAAGLPFIGLAVSTELLSQAQVLLSEKLTGCWYRRVLDPYREYGRAGAYDREVLPRACEADSGALLQLYPGTLVVVVDRFSSLHTVTDLSHCAFAARCPSFGSCCSKSVLVRSASSPRSASSRGTNTPPHTASWRRAMNWRRQDAVSASWVSRISTRRRLASPSKRSSSAERIWRHACSRGYEERPGVSSFCIVIF
jgi:hypothetical protein